LRRVEESYLNRTAGIAPAGRRSHLVLLAFPLLLAALAATFVDAAWLRGRRATAIALESDIAGRLGLSDLCLFTEARYTRHLSQADLHSAFQDHPAALEHFPAGSLVSPPSTLTDRHENLDRKTEIPD
jgi:hypothetical protein